MHATGQEIPANLYQIISESKSGKKVAKHILGNGNNWPETQSLYYDNIDSFEATVLDVVQKEDKVYLILDRTAFYPLSGGQESDAGHIEIEDTKYQIAECFKSGKWIYHLLKSLPSEQNLTIDRQIQGKRVRATIDAKRRKQLTQHHTAAHIISAVCRKVLGSHVWQQGARKTVVEGHIDICLLYTSDAADE
eukprot:TRINITY_DN1245_c0_g1_i1.p1 TRINITY_DN1245_c0_g1~~TRINITY_DN1245_c0_g1_i1.p1  ORF type:complete len:192 (-),score=18.22 TRINITY_DN1245_c0_g1_i1:57-632(-)